MVRRTSGRHARPRGRGRFRGTDTPLELDVAALRSASFSDYLELVRLSALVDGLVAQVERLSFGVPAARRELEQARTAPPPHDPRVDVLRDELSGLQTSINTNHVLLADVTRHVLDLFARVVDAAPVDRVSSAQATTPVPAMQPVATPQPVTNAPTSERGPSPAAEPAEANVAVDEGAELVQLVR